LAIALNPLVKSILIITHQKCVFIYKKKKTGYYPVQLQSTDCLFKYGRPSWI
jgi:hypothetical protein